MPPRRSNGTRDEAGEPTQRQDPVMRSPAARRLRVPKTAEVVAADLRSQIVRGQVAEGDFLPDDAALMAQYQISRPTLREAFRILESEGLISTRRGAKGGTQVHAPDIGVAARYVASVLQWSGTTVDDVYEARQLIEPIAARIGAERRPAAALARLRETLEYERSVVQDPTLFPAAAAKFHTQVVELSGNLTLSLLAAVVQEIVASQHAASAQRETGGKPTRNVGLSAHEKLVRLVEEGKADEAEKLWRSHMEIAGAVLRRGAGGTRVVDLLD